MIIPARSYEEVEHLEHLEHLLPATYVKITLEVRSPNAGTIEGGEHCVWPIATAPRYGMLMTFYFLPDFV